MYIDLVIDSILNRLRADVPTDPENPNGELSTLVRGIYDQVPEKEAKNLPYLLVTRGHEEEWHQFGQEGSKVTITLQIWSNKPDVREYGPIARRVKSLLDNAYTNSNISMSAAFWDTSDMERQSNYLRYVPMTVTYYVNPIG
jgi:hypothetical protein